MKILFLAIVTLIIFQFSLIVPIYADIAVVGVIGQEGTSDGDFQNPYGIAIDSSNKIFVSDFGFDNIQAFDSSGNFLFKWGENGPLESQFERLYGIDSDKFDNIYVADTFNHRVQVFDNSGNFLEKLGTNGPAPGQFDQPIGIESDSEDRIYVVDRNNDRVQILLYSTDKPISLELTKDDTNLINLIGELENTLRIDSALIEIKTLTGDTILQDSILINSDGKFNFDFELPQNLVDDAYNAIITIEVDGITITKTKTIFLYDEIPEGETCPVGQKPFFIEETSLWDCRDENTGLVVEADDKNFFSSIIEIIKSILRSIRGSL